jgi:UDP-glucose 4-epimerase
MATRTRLVTGGLGFIGNELVRQLRRHGEVAILDNRSRPAPRIDDIADIPLYEVDVTNRSGVQDALERVRPDCVFHLAALHYIPECNANPELTLHVNVEGTLAVLNACVAAGVPRVVVASSGAIYEDSQSPLAEDAKIAPVDVYGWSKAFAEDLGRWVAKRDGIQVVSARLFNTYGPRETNRHIIPEILAQLRHGTTLHLGVVDTIRDYVHSRDVAEALRRLGDGDTPGFSVFNVATGRGASVAELVRLIGEQMERDLRIELDTARLRTVDKKTQIADVTKMRKATGWEARLAFRDGLRDLLSFEALL